MDDRYTLTKEEKVLIKDILGETSGYLKQYILSCVYLGAEEDEIDAMTRKMNMIYMKLERELRED